MSPSSWVRPRPYLDRPPCYGGWIAIEHLVYGNPVPGWPTVVVGLMFFSGVQLLSIGILGEYIGRIFDEVKRRPLYVLRQASGSGRLGHDPAQPP